MKCRNEIFNDDGIFRKYYDNAEELRRELQIYEQKLPFLPELIKVSTEPEELFCDYKLIIGCNLWERDPADFHQVGKLYARLHSSKTHYDKSICQIDTNPQNIIYEYDPERYWLVDFVDWRWEYPEYDLIHFLLFWAAVKPEDQFLMLSIDFLKGYQKIREVDLERWKDLYDDVCACFDNRRLRYNKSEKTNNTDQPVNRKQICNCFTT